MFEGIAMLRFLCWLGLHKNPRHSLKTPGYPRFGACCRCGKPTFMYLSSVDNFIADMRHVRPN